MRIHQTAVHIAPAEWRWVFIVALLLLALALLPFLLVATNSTATGQWQFMGVLDNYLDGATYIAKMRQGYEGAWLIQFRHSPEPHTPLFIQALYPALGHLAQLTNLPPLAMFHVARIAAALVMYMALYYLAATIWPRRRSRRIFFIVAAIASGLGWLLIIASGGDSAATRSPDLAIPEMFPFYSSLVNVHFPLTFAALAFLTSILLTVFSPGNAETPSASNGGLAAGMLSLALSVLYPQVLVPIFLAAGLSVLVLWSQRRRASWREVYWLTVLALPALPMAIYYVAILTYNPAAAEWTQQNQTLAPPFLIFLVGLGVPLLIAVPALVRAVRRFNLDSDLFVLLWLVVMVACVFAPFTAIQRRFAAGLMIPLAYFVTRALEDYWFKYVSRRWRYRLLAVVLPAVTMTYLLLFLGNLSLISGQIDRSGPFLHQDYTRAFEWLRGTVQPDSVILAAPDVSTWIPGWLGGRVVYGHPYETLNAQTRLQQVEAWYSAVDSAGCAALLAEVRVQYILVGPAERALGDSACLKGLTPVFTADSVAVYAPAS